MLVQFKLGSNRKPIWDLFFIQKNATCENVSFGCFAVYKSNSQQQVLNNFKMFDLGKQANLIVKAK